MGVDFIRALSHRPWRKGWNKGLDLLREPNLFSPQVEECDRVVAIRLEEGSTIVPGAECGLHLNGEKVVATDNLRIIGTVDAPTQNLLDALQATNGVGFAKVVRLGSFQDTADLRISQ